MKLKMNIQMKKTNVVDHHREHHYDRDHVHPQKETTKKEKGTVNSVLASAPEASEAAWSSSKCKSKSTFKAMAKAKAKRSNYWAMLSAMSFTTVLLMLLGGATKVNGDPTLSPTLAPTTPPPEFDKARILQAFGDINMKLQYLDLDIGFDGSAKDVLNEPIPLFGQSLNNVVSESVTGGSTILDTLNFASDASTNFLSQDEYTKDDTKSLVTEIETRFQQLLGAGAKLTANPTEPGNCASATSPITATFADTELVIQFCSKILFKRSTPLSGDNLFSNIEQFVSVDFKNAPLDVSAGLAFEASLTIDANGEDDPRAVAEVKPLVIDLEVNVQMFDIDVNLGMLQVGVDDASVDASSTFTLEVCDGTCDDDGTGTGTEVCVATACSTDGKLVPGSLVKITRSGNYVITGALSLDASSKFEGLPDFGTNELQISDADFYNSAPEIILPNLQEFIDSMMSFSPQSAVGIIRAFDTLLTRTHDSELVDVGIPLTNKKIADVITTGGVLLAKQLELFERAQDFSDRAAKSLSFESEFDIKATSIVPEDKDGNFLPTKINFLYFKSTNKNFLNTSPGNWNGLFHDSGITKCNVIIAKNPTSESLVDNLFDGIDGCGGLIACKSSEVTCEPMANGDIASDCLEKGASKECHIYLGVKQDTKVFITTTTSFDFQLIGLYQDEKDIRGATSLYGLPVNDPVLPALVPQFSNFDELVAKINTAIVGQFPESPVDVKIDYIDDEDVDVPARVEIFVEFSKITDVEKVAFVADASVGDLNEVNAITPKSPSASVELVDIKGDVDFSATFGVLLGPDKKEQLRLNVSPCQKQGRECPIPNDIVGRIILNDSKPYDFTIRKSETKTDIPKAIATAFTLANVPEGSVAVEPRPNSDKNIVRALGDKNMLLRFGVGVDEYELQFEGYCVDPSTKDRERLDNTLRFECPEGFNKDIEKTVGIPLGLKDSRDSKRPFQIGIGKLNLDGGINVDATVPPVQVSATLGELISVKADLTTDFTGELQLSLGTDRMINAIEWLIALPKVPGPSDVKGYKDGFFNGKAVFSGTVNAVVTASEPFVGIKKSVSGTLNKLDLDLLDLSRLSEEEKTKNQLPEFELDIDLPTIGGVKNLGFADIDDLLGLTLKFLVGAGGVQSCSGGLLGTELEGEKIFLKTLPVLSITPCDTVSGLQVIVDAVDTLSDEEDGGGMVTLSALKTKLESLLNPDDVVTINTASDTDPGFSDLMIGLGLDWSFSSTNKIGFDLEELLKSDNSIPFDDFKTSLSTSGTYDLVSEVAVNLGLGIQYNVGESDPERRATPYLSCGSSFSVTFSATGGGEFNATFGPLVGSADVHFEVGQPAPLTLNIRIQCPPGIEYLYLRSPGDEYLQSRPNFQYLERAGCDPETSVIGCGVEGILDGFDGFLEIDFDGSFTGNFKGELPAIGAALEFDFNLADIKEFLQDPANGIEFPNGGIQFTEPTREIDSFLDVLFKNPETMIKTLKDILDTLEDSSLGKRGIIAQYEIPFIGNAVSQSLKVGKPDNFLGKIKSNLLPRMEEYLNSKLEVDGFAENFRKVIDDELRNNKLIKAPVTVTCYKFIDGVGNVALDDCDDGDPTSIEKSITSVEWNIPISFGSEIEIPLDLKLDGGFPLSFEIGGDGDEKPKLKNSVAFNLGFGFDSKDGFYLQTYPEPDRNNESSEITVTTFLYVPATNITANLLFLNAKIEGLEIVAGAEVNVNVVKPKETGEKDRRYGRLTAGEFQNTRIRDLVEISGTIAAGLDLGAGRLFVDGDGFGIAAKYIPEITFGGGYQFRQEFDAGDSTPRRTLSSSTSPLHPLEDAIIGADGSVRRHLIQETTRAKKFRPKRGTIRSRQRSLPKVVPLSDADLDKIIDIRHHHDHRAVPLLHSLHRTLTEKRRRRRGLRSLYTQDQLFANDFAASFTACSISESECSESESCFCGKISNVGVNFASIGDAVRPIVNEFVNDDGKSGYLDQIVPKLKFLNEKQDQLSKLLGFDVTILNVADVYLGEERSGTDTVRDLLEVYETISNLVERFNGDESLLIAKECEFDLKQGFQCYGGITGKAAPNERRLQLGIEDHGQFQLDVEEHGMAEIYDFVDPSGQPVTPRHLATCVGTYTPFTEGNECNSSCPGTLSETCRAECLASKSTCLSNGIKGLSFPPFNDPKLLLNLIQGESVTLVDFKPPKVTFGMETFLEEILYVGAPGIVVTLRVTFSFSCTLEAGFVYQSDGIQAAVGELVPEYQGIDQDVTSVKQKMLNAFALRDTFGGVDIPLITLTGSIVLSVDVSAGIVKVTAGGGLTAIITIDLYDPRPEESGGLVRPYELFNSGKSPEDWFEFSIELYLQFTVSIKVGIFVGFFEKKIYEKNESSPKISIFGPLFIEPKEVGPIGRLDSERVLELFDQSDKTIKCVRLSGSLGEEDVECQLQEGDLPLYQTFKNIKRISVPNQGESGMQYTFKCIESPIDIYDGQFTILDYSDCVATPGSIAIGSKAVKVGIAEYNFEFLTTRGNIFLPATPKIQGLITTFTGCNHPWTLIGHTNLLLEASEIQGDCEVTADGDELDAEVEVNFDTPPGVCPKPDPENPDNKNTVVIRDVDGAFALEITKAEADPSKLSKFSVELGALFNVATIVMSPCDDKVTVNGPPSTDPSPNPGTIFIDTRGGDDEITINNLSTIPKNIEVAGGDGADSLTIIDKDSMTGKNTIRLNSYALRGIQPENADLDLVFLVYRGFEFIDVEFSQGENVITVASTAKDSLTELWCGDAKDIVTIEDTQGPLTVYGNGGNDVFNIKGLGTDDSLTDINGKDRKAEIYGGPGNDQLNVDGIDDTENKLSNSTLRWNGQGDDDTATVKFAGFGTDDFFLDLFDDREGENNVLNIQCTEEACDLLSRGNFIAAIHDVTNTDESTVERINFDNVDIARIAVDLNNGENSMFFDDTYTTISVTGGPDDDHFQIGQRFNDPTFGDNDPVEVDDTTEGFLSVGCSDPLTIYGKGGNDKFEVLRNKNTLDLDGDCGDDTFIIRSFLALTTDGDGNKVPDLGKLTLLGGNDNDNVVIGYDESTESQSMLDLPEYIVNSLVDVDGGPGNDAMTIVGTQDNDQFVVADGKVLGGGLSVLYRNIETLVLDAREGDDTISVLSTSPKVQTKLYGNRGSDTFVVGAKSVEPIVSKNLQGHRGIIEYTILSPTDEEYDGLKIAGTAVDVLDNDGDNKWVQIVRNKAQYLLSEDGDDKLSSFDFTVYPTTVPRNPDGADGTPLKVKVNSPVDGDTAYVMLSVNGKEPKSSIELNFEKMEPQVVTVTYNKNAKKLTATDKVLAVSSVVSKIGTSDTGFLNTEQSLVPVLFTLLPTRHENTMAKSVTIVESNGGTSVMEDGFNDTYDIYLRPCTESMRDDTYLNIMSTVPNQVKLSKTGIITGTDWEGPDGDCRVPITVTAIDDDITEADHFVTLLHEITDSKGEPVSLDGCGDDFSPLSASNVLVRIYDDDIAGVVIEETLGYSAVAEINDDNKADLNDPSLYEDTLTIRLTKEPNGDVDVIIKSVPTATDQEDPPRTRNQLLMMHPDGAKTEDTITVTFTKEDWYTNKAVTIKADNDNVAEGIDLLYFPSQPSFLAFIQGPVLLAGDTGEDIPPIRDPVLYPGETDSDICKLCQLVKITSIFVDDTKQVDTLIIENLDVRGELPSIGVLSDTQFQGMNMGRNIVIEGTPQVDGIEYLDMEIVEMRLGDGVEEITVEATSTAIHYVDLGGEHDKLFVKNIDGPFIVLGGHGSDTVTVSSDETKLDQINALLAFDGGPAESEEIDSLTLDNSADTSIDEVLNVTRSIVEMLSLSSSPTVSPSVVPSSMPSTTPSGRPTITQFEPSQSAAPSAPPSTTTASSRTYLINLYKATEGSFKITLYDPVKDRTRSKVFDISLTKFDLACRLEKDLYEMIIPKGERYTCGTTFESECTDAVKVYPYGDKAFAVFFVGERRGVDVELQLDTTNLRGGFEPELFLEEPQDILLKNSDVAYANVEYLDVKMGTLDHAINVRGATASTTITTQGGDDYVFISNDANELPLSTLDVLPGWLDYVEGDLTVNVGTGTHRLMMSDITSPKPKGSQAKPAVLTKNSLTDLADNLGNIYFNTDVDNGGEWTVGVDLWLGLANDVLNVMSVPATGEATTEGSDDLLSVTTSVHANDGNDILTISLDAESHVGSIFVANGQNDNDIIDASKSSHPVLLFGGRGNDAIKGGSGSDVIFGDLGRVIWREHVVAAEPTDGTEDAIRNRRQLQRQLRPIVVVDDENYDDVTHEDGDIIGVAGNGGYGDFGVRRQRPISELFSRLVDKGGVDIIDTGDGDNIAIGGQSGDTITGGAHRDILFGDIGIVINYPGTSIPWTLNSTSYTNCDVGGNDIIHAGDGEVDYVIGGTYNDTLWGEDGMDLVIGDHGYILLNDTKPYRLVYVATIDPNCTGGSDTINLGPGDDIAMGGALGDVINGNEGQDLIFGDFAEYDSNVEFLPYQNYKTITNWSKWAGPDVIDGGYGDDIIFGCEDADIVNGGAGNDDITGGHNVRYGRDTGDDLSGDDGDDVILGDNGQILRTRLSSADGDYPWIHGSVWLTYPKPFDTSVIRDISRYDDIDYIEGDDTLRGNSGNDILIGQRGDDKLFGGDGEDELIGGLGSDYLDGGGGIDILIGDIGYAVRRYKVDDPQSPELLKDLTGTTSSNAWKKDIVLEELGNVTSATRISQQVDISSLTAEQFSTSSLAFVAGAYDSANGKYLEEGTTEWVNYLVLFDLVQSYNDTLVDEDTAPNVLIGQRGDDNITGSGLLIGDAGTNTIPQNTDIPRIYQTYRMLSAPDETGYLSGEDITDFGLVFDSFYNLYPDQYGTIQYLSSITDDVVALDDLQSGSNLLRDQLGINGIPVSASGQEYYLQPLLRLTTGFTNPTQHLHGNDVIATTTAGNSIVVGDDIKGSSPFDLDDLLAIHDLRTSLNDLVYDLGVRMSVMEIDAAFYRAVHSTDNKAPLVDYDIVIGSDTITTSTDGLAFVTGDTLTMYGRTLLGDVLSTTTDLTVDPKSATPSSELISTSRNIVNYLFDLELMLMNTNLALYELHTELLRKMTSASPSTTDPLPTLHLGNDGVTSSGDGDIVVGDSTVFFAQADRQNSGIDGYSFKPDLWSALATDIDKLFSTKGEIIETRSIERDSHRDTRLNVSEPADLKSVTTDDVPFYLKTGQDTLTQTGPSYLGVGDYGFVGFVRSSDPIPGNYKEFKGKGTAGTTNLQEYPRAIESVQRRLYRDSPGSGTTRKTLDVPFYEKRYDSATSKDVTPSFFADSLTSTTSGGVLLGDFFTGIGFDHANQADGQANPKQAVYSINTFASGESAPVDAGAPDKYFSFMGIPGPDGVGDVSPDTINVLGDGPYDGNLGKDIINVGDGTTGATTTTINTPPEDNTIPIRRRRLDNSGGYDDHHHHHQDYVRNLKNKNKNDSTPANPPPVAEPTPDEGDGGVATAVVLESGGASSKNVELSKVSPMLHKLFYEHNLVKQWIQDIYDVPVLRESLSPTILSTTTEPDVTAAVGVPPMVVPSPGGNTQN